MDEPMTVPAITPDTSPQRAMEIFEAVLRGARVVEPKMMECEMANESVEGNE